MALEGTLQDFALGDIFQLIAMQRKTGVLTVAREGEAVRVFLQEGNLVWAESGEGGGREERLGDVLVRRGLLMQDRLTEARRRRQRGGQPFLRILLQEEWVRPLEMQRVIEQEVLETVFRIFRWQEGRYRFVPTERLDLPHGCIDPIGAENILLEAIRQIDEWPQIKRHLPSFDIVIRRCDGAGAIDVQHLTPEESQVMACVDDLRTAREVIDRSGLLEFAAGKSLAELIGRGFLEAVFDEAPVRVEAPARRRVALRLVWFPAWIVPAGLVVLVFGTLLMHVQLYAQAPVNLVRPAAATAPTVGRVAFQTQVQTIAQALDLYRLASGAYPDELARLAGAGGLSPEFLFDPWGRALGYERRGAGYRLITAGTDGRSGTADDQSVTVRAPGAD